jgi:TetR/AcrR family transcriptional regulator, tetracycline repressor protein
MALLDERGLDELTTRPLAERLGVQVGALYWHVHDKRELLTALAGRIVAEALPPGPMPERDWAAHMRDVAHRLRAAMLRHRDGARLVAGYAPVDLGALQMAEAGLRLMRASGASLADAAYAGDALMSYVTGFVLQEQSSPALSKTDQQKIARELASLPLFAEWTATRPAKKDVAFATGVELIIAGVRPRLTLPE